MTEATLMADGFVVGRHIDQPDLIRLRFTGGDDAFNIIMPIAHGQVVAQEIDNATVQSKPEPIGPDELKLGTIFRLLGQQVRSESGGGKRLVLTIEMANGARTIPISLSPQEITELVSDLSD